MTTVAASMIPNIVMTHVPNTAVVSHASITPKSDIIDIYRLCRLHAIPH